MNELMSERMNENLSTKPKVNNSAFIYTCWEREKSVFFNAVTLDILTIPMQSSCSGLVDQHVIDLMWLLLFCTQA